MHVALVIWMTTRPGQRVGNEHNPRSLGEGLWWQLQRFSRTNKHMDR